MRNLIPAAMLVSASACGTMPDGPPSPSQAPQSPVEACSSATLARFAGQPATSALGAQMLAATGKTAIRWVQPGMMVTMDFRADRLTVYLDADNRVERANCG